MKKKILIADDDAAIQFLLEQVLTDAGYSVIHAVNGEEAIRLAQSKKPDLILLDLVMPKMHGYEVCRKIRANPDPKISQMKVVVVSVKNYPVDVRSAKLTGIDKYVVKPFSVRELLVIIQDMLAPTQPPA